MITATKWPGRMFKIPTPSEWWVVVTDPKHMEEIRKAPDNKLCHQKLMEEVIRVVLRIPLNLRVHIPDLSNTIHFS